MDAYQRMTDEEKNRTSVRFSYFILLSTECKESGVKLDDYVGRTQEIETVPKASKKYLHLLSLEKMVGSNGQGEAPL